MFWKNENPNLFELAKEYERNKRHIKALMERQKAIEEEVEAAGLVLQKAKKPPVDGKWELPAWTVTFSSRVNVHNATAKAFLRGHPEYWGCFEQKLSARKPKLLKAYEGAPVSIVKDLEEVFELVASKPRFKVKIKEDQS